MKFGLLGEHLSHSYSKKIHEDLFLLKKIDATYDLIEISEDQLKEYINKIRNKEYQGYNVTIPYKKTVMKYLDVIDPVAKDIGAVNTIYFKDGLVHGTNTDYFGFVDELKYYRISPKGKECFVLGTGGASMACQKALEDLGGDVIKVSREPRDKKMISYQELEKMKSLEIVVNTTPVGMYPNVLSSPLDKNTAKKANVIIDIIFNPKKTLLMSYNNKSHNGLRMLLMQAVKAEDIWLDKEYNIDYNEYFIRLKEMI